MKKTMKIITIALALISVLAVCAFAADFEAAADSLNELGLFKGTDKGYELDREPTRVEAGVMLVRLLGAEEEALSLSYTAPFTDVYDWAKPYVQYLYDKGLTKGMSETRFGYSEKCTAKMYATFLLRALGYSDSEGGDFTYDKAVDFAREKGVADSVNCSEDAFLRDHVAAMSYTALSIAPKSGETDLLAKLEASGAIDDVKGYDKKFSSFRTFCESLELLNAGKASCDMKLTTVEKIDGGVARTTVQNVKSTVYTDEENPDKSMLSYVGSAEIKFSDGYADALEIPEGERTVKENVEYYYIDGYFYINLDGVKFRTKKSIDSITGAASSINMKPGAIPLAALSSLESKTGSDGSVTYSAVLDADDMTKILSELDGKSTKYGKIEYTLTVKDESITAFGVKLDVEDVRDGIVVTLELTGELTNIKTGDSVRITLPADLDEYVPPIED